MLRRKAYDRLMEWKESGKKPLLVYGQRQVGKTFIIKKFAEENYSKYLYIDLSAEEKYRSAFCEGDRNVDTIILSICTIGSLGKIEPEDFVLILDEIQDCEEALSSLKMFANDGRYKVIASGSMLGVTISHKIDGNKPRPLSPMGYVEPYLMTSMDFEEFLWSQNIPAESIDLVRECVKNNEPILEAIRGTFTKLFRTYMIVGGMPASVEVFNSDRSTFEESSKEKEHILGQIHRDINRYNSGIDAIKTAQCFMSIPYQLSQTNKRFHYSRLENDTSSVRKAADRYMGNLLWIKGAGYGNFVYGLNQITTPITGQIKQDVFRVYVSDTGLLTQMYGPEAIVAIYESEYKHNLGAIAENVVAECLSKCGYKVTYYQKKNGDGRMEIDFVIGFVKGPVAIEVKSGKTRDSPSIEKVGTVFNVFKRIKLEDSNISVDKNGLIHLPLFASAFIDSMDDVPEYIRKRKIDTN